MSKTDIEKWTDVKNYNGAYQVSSFGNVRSTNRKLEYIRHGNPESKNIQGKILALIPGNDGYDRVTLSKNRILTTYTVHRIVASHFIEKIPGKEFVNHKNGIKTDNRVLNLEWCTCQENARHASKMGLYNYEFRGPKKVMQFDLNGNFIKQFKSAAEASRQLNILATGIGMCARGQRKTYKGFNWEFLNKE